jgi:hypothetical protein
MKDYNLGFISNSEIYNQVRQMVLSYRKEIILSQFNENIDDPIKDAYAKGLELVAGGDFVKQHDSRNTKYIGLFQSNIFKCVGNGWAIPGEDFDIENKSLHIYVEMSNSTATCAVSLRKTYIKMQSKLLEDSKATCCLVESFTNGSVDENLKITIDNKACTHNKIRRMSMDKFYELVFGDKFAYYKLCKALPSVIEDVIRDDREAFEIFLNMMSNELLWQ